ncbi:MAG: TVP38/TMEM64 family protein [Limisphaerales bacterium]
MAARSQRELHERLADWRDRHGPALPLVFIVLFVLNTVACLPAGVMTLAGGFLFGPLLGIVCVWTGAILGASAAFGISRHFGRDWIRRRLARRPLLSAVEQAVSEEGWKIVILTRLAPGSPFFLLNYLFGLTRIRFRDYFWSTAVSVIPGSFLLVYLGSLGELAVSGRIRSPAEWALYGAGAVALLGAVWLIARRAKAILRRKLDPPHPRPATNEDHSATGS